MAQRALLLINPHARKGRQSFSHLMVQLHDLSFELVEPPSINPRLFSDLIRQYQHEVDLVIIGGGDGTLNSAASGLIDTQLPLGILPLGTANDFARTLGIPLLLPEACQVIANGILQRIDLGCVNGKFFFNAASLGLSVQITERLSKKSKQHWGILIYAIAALETIWYARTFRADITLNNKLVRVKSVQVTIGNGQYYGGGLNICENAAIDDQQLHFYSLNVRHWWQLIALLPTLKLGKHPAWTGIHACRCQEIEIVTYPPQPINTDGEITTYTPAKFQVIPKALNVIVPNNFIPPSSFN